MSRDFSHFVFSSNNYIEGFFGGSTHPAVVFAPGGQTEGLGSAYDNNIETREVNVISKLPSGEPIPLQAARTVEEKAIDFRGVSTGRHAHPDGNARRTRRRANSPTCSSGSTTRSPTTSPKATR